MKGLGYGQGYAYDHDAEDAWDGLHHMAEFVCQHRFDFGDLQP